MLENRSELLLPHGDRVNINNNCYINLSSSGKTHYEKYYKQFESFGVSVPELKIYPKGAIFQIHEVMHVFGPAFVDESREAPFTKVFLDLDDSFDPENNLSRTRTIDVNDFILVELNRHGQEIVNKRFRTPIFRTIGPLTEMQFHTAAHLFSPSLFNGSNSLPFQKNMLYIPEK